MRRIKCLFFILIFLLPISIHAHVIVFYRDKPPIHDVLHRIILIYDEDNQKVGLAPQISFSGDPRDFCVVVPTPTTPQLHTVTREVFNEAQQLTSPIWRERGTGCLSGGNIVTADQESLVSVGNIDIVSEESSGGFVAQTLSDDANALTKWLDDNNYKYSAQDKDMIDYYAQRGWVFTVTEIDMSESEMSKYDRYNINHVLFSFSVNSLIYPIRLASINAGDRTNVELYVLSDSKMTFPGARVEYVNRINDKELEEILDRYPDFGGLIGQLPYLTKLKRIFSIMEMDADIEIVPALDNEEFRDIVYQGVSPATDFVPLGVVAVFFLTFRALRKRKRDVFKLFKPFPKA